MSNTLIISSDGHAALPLGEYRPYVDPGYREVFDESLAANARVNTNFAQNVDPKLYEPYRKAFYDSGAIDGRWDAARRVGELDAEGIIAEVLFPDGAPFSAGGIGGNRDRYERELEQVGARAYNRWIADFVSAAPDRFGGQAIINLWDVAAAVADVYWAREHGLRGIVMPGLDDSMPRMWDPCYEPFWAACEETGLPLNYHGGIGGVGMPDYGPPVEGVAHQTRLRIQYFEFRWFAHRPLWWAIWSGILERHPGLKMVFTEQHSDWVPGALALLDHSYDNSMFDESIKDIVPLRPSEYWARQCYTGSSTLSRNDLRARHQIGVKNMMFGADFPHPEGTCLRTTRYLQATVGETGMTEEEARDFLGRTAADVFGFDAERLAPIVAEHGLDLAQVLTPLGPEHQAEFARTDVVRPPT